MMPINDNIVSHRKPWVTYALIAINIIIFVWQLTLRRMQVNMQYLYYGFTPAFLFHGSAPAGVHPLLTLFTSQFLHGGWSHIIGNMLYLWVFGDNIEDELGHLPFLLFYLGSGAVGALAHGFMDMDSLTPLIGASGAIAGLLGAYFILYPGARIRSLIPIFFFFYTVSVPAIFYLGAWFLLQVINNTFSGGADTVAYGAHIGGFVVGVIVALWLKKRRRNRWEIREPGHDDFIPLQ